MNKRLIVTHKRASYRIAWNRKIVVGKFALAPRFQHPSNYYMTFCHFHIQEAHVMWIFISYFNVEKLFLPHLSGNCLILRFTLFRTATIILLLNSKNFRNLWFGNLRGWKNRTPPTWNISSLCWRLVEKQKSRVLCLLGNTVG
jgi:hypothetical protein